MAKLFHAQEVVIGVGVDPFKYLPPNLCNIPPELISHSGEYGPIERLAGKDVAVLGSGASATDLAVLLHDKGANVSLMARATELPFMPTPEEKKIIFAKLRQFASPLKSIKRLLSPHSCIGSSWLLKFCAEAPQIFHKLPEKTRLEIVRSELGPSGHWAIEDHLDEHINLYLGHNLDAVESLNGKLNLHLSSHQGTKESIRADHLIAATGYKIDLTKLEFLKNLIPDINMVENTPILSSNYETSLPGLFFIGPASANSFGPVNRFVCGAVHPARRITEHLKKKSNKRIEVASKNENESPGSEQKQTHSPNVLVVAAMFRTPYRALRCAHAAGANIYVMGTKEAEGLKSSRYCKTFIPSDRPITGNYDEELAGLINQHLANHSIDIVLAGDTPSTRSLIAIRHLLSRPCFPMPKLEQFDRLNNKWEFYLLCNSLGIECPPSTLFENPSEITNNGLIKAKIAKPLNKEGGIGVLKLEPENAQMQLEKINYSPIMVQDFIEGEDIGASVFCRNGKITAFLSHSFRRYVYESFFDANIFNSISKIVEHLQLDGIFNFDMRRTSDGRIYFLECNPRVFWKMSMSMLSGINFVSFGLSNPKNDGLIRPPQQPVMVRYPKSTLLHAAIAPWKLEKSSWNVLHYLYSDPVPYFREMCGLENEEHRYQ